ncbi:hypothetical protein [Mucilaginibacter sp.]|uniref:hypothetical protein n=1 Tax=Mucilaginibacter sp. TaxID=1882438 RepID=UPI00262AD881|nr:hypothetical protein [Mucilaginibacter sp.]MDB4927183.1 hypothetical protein [Mucilaginibacter sp.]
MDQAELIKQINATIGKIKVLELGKLLTDNKFNLRDLIAVTLYPDNDIAFRATWLLENVFLQDPEIYLPDLEYLLSKMAVVKAPGSKRHYAKIVMHITDAGAPQIIKEKVQTLDLEHVVEQLFDWMIDPKIKIAVKAFTAEALFNLRHRYDWITEELVNQLHYLMRNGTAAIQSKGKKLLKELE